MHVFKSHSTSFVDILDKKVIWCQKLFILKKGIILNFQINLFHFFYFKFIKFFIQGKLPSAFISYLIRLNYKFYFIYVLQSYYDSVYLLLIDYVSNGSTFKFAFTRGMHSLRVYII